MLYENIYWADREDEIEMADNLYIVIPAYNEQENIKDCVEGWYPKIDTCVRNGGVNSRLVIIDDGSSDNTYSLLCDLVEEYPYLLPITKTNGGHGETLLYGYRMAIENNVDYVFQTDSDGQTNPDEFESFWMLREKWDAIIGKRLVRGDGLSRKWIENIVCLLLKIFFGVHLQHANAPFRLMKTSLLAKYMPLLLENYNLPNIMLTTYFVYYSEKVTFLPITFYPRTKGKNTINVKKILKIGWNALRDFKKLRENMKNVDKNSLG